MHVGNVVLKAKLKNSILTNLITPLFFTSLKEFSYIWTANKSYDSIILKINIEYDNAFEQMK